jgi:hypothetical protein
MIDIQTKIHDQFTIEFKVGYIANENLPKSDFEMNTWIFLPDNLDINRRTYPKDIFYRNVRSQLRLITPVYTLKELADTHNLPFKLLQSSCRTAVSSSDIADTDNFESQVKMYASIYKSAIRNAYNNICSEHSPAELHELCQRLIDEATELLKQYRSIQPSISQSNNNTLQKAYQYGDEFISNVTEQHFFKLADFLKERHADIWEKIQTDLFNLLDAELRYKKQMQYPYVEQDDSTENRRFVHRASLLKKYAESNLYLKARKRQNTFFLEQLAFMLAAGIAMTFATIIAFSFQQTFGNFTLPLFIALVVSYMFKDRIKDLIRFYFAHRLGSKFYDYKITMSIRNRMLGWSKEGFDYIHFSKVPRPIDEKRSRTALLEARRGTDEQVILYRKKLHLNTHNLKEISPYPFVGVNDIIRFNLLEFMRKMDNPPNTAICQSG